MFFDVHPALAVINDYNEQLVNIYDQIKADYAAVVQQLDQMQDAYNTLETEEEQLVYYYDIRKKYNDSLASRIKSHVSAAQFIFLNKSCFNGLYRVNRKGRFNAASAHKKVLNTFQLDNIKEVSSALQNVTIHSGDFEVACKNAKKGDFVFFDSPYYDTFDNYQSEGFSKADHLRLAALFKELTAKGVKCMLTNSNTDFIKELYKDFNIEVVDVKRLISCKASKRTGQEVIITNYESVEQNEKRAAISGSPRFNQSTLYPYSVSLSLQALTSSAVNREAYSGLITCASTDKSSRPHSQSVENPSVPPGLEISCLAATKPPLLPTNCKNLVGT